MSIVGWEDHGFDAVRGPGRQRVKLLWAAAACKRAGQPPYRLILASRWWLIDEFQFAPFFHLEQTGKGGKVTVTITSFSS